MTVPVLAMHLSTYNSRALAKIWRNYLYSTKNQKLMKTRELRLRFTNSSESFIQLQTQSKHTSHFLPVRRRRRIMITYCTQVAIHLHTFIEQSTMLVIYEAKNAPVHKIAPKYPSPPPRLPKLYIPLGLPTFLVHPICVDPRLSAGRVRWQVVQPTVPPTDLSPETLPALSIGTPQLAQIDRVKTPRASSASICLRPLLYSRIRPDF